MKNRDSIKDKKTLFRFWGRAKRLEQSKAKKKK